MSGALRPVLAWVRIDARHRWRSLLVLALLVAFAAGTVMTAVAGVRRGATALDRLLDRTLPATALVWAATPGFDWAAVRGLPEVEALAEIAYSGYEVDGRAESYVMLPPVDAEAMRTVERPVVLDGRLTDPARPDEVVVTPAFAANTGKGVGDTVALGLYTPDQIDTAQGPDELPVSLAGLAWLLTADQMAAALDSGNADLNESKPAAGPVVDATIVGVVRSPWFGDVAGEGYVIPSAGLFAQYPEHVLGEQGFAATSALVRLHGGAADVPALQRGLAEVAGSADLTVTALDSPLQEVRDVIGFESVGLVVFAGVAGLASVVLLGLLVARYATGAVGDLHVLRAAGMRPGQARLAAATGPAAAALVGTAIGAVGAVAASRWFPVGSAAVVEPAPGLDVDPLVLLTGLVVVPVLAGCCAAAAAWLVLRAGNRPPAQHRSALADAATASGLPVPVAMGTRFALEPGRGRQAVPVRPALLGVVAGVAGVLATVTFAAAVDDAATNPARLGTVSQLEAYVGFDSVPFSPADPDTIFAALAAVPGVTGVNDTRGQLGEAGGEQLLVMTFDPVGRPLDYVVTDGRLPVGGAEVFLGPRSADQLGAGIGDTVTVTGSAGTADLLVVGIGFIVRATGAITTAGTYATLFGDTYTFHYGDVALTPGADRDAMVPVLRDALRPVLGDAADRVGLIPSSTDGDIPAVLRYLRQLPVFLAGFLVVLATAAVGYGLVLAVRRRKGDLAVLRATGMTPGQCRGVLVSQASVLALVGLVAGAPLGIAVGRTVWRYVADSVQVHYVPPASGVALLLAIPATLAVINLLAAWPGRWAARLPIGPTLRTE